MSALENNVDEMVINYTKDFPCQPFCSIESLMGHYEIRDNGLVLKDDTIIIDIRSDMEQNVSMLPGAITKYQFESMKEYGHLEVVNSSYTIIVYCTVGYRSARYTNELINRGYKKVYNSPGILKWCHYHHNKASNVGTPFKTHLVCKFNNVDVHTNRVHVFSSKWDLVPYSYIGVVFTNWEFNLYILQFFGDKCLKMLGWK